MSGYCVYEIYQLPEAPSLSQLEAKTKINLHKSTKQMTLFMPQNEKDLSELKNAALVFKTKVSPCVNWFQTVFCGPQVIPKANYVQFLQKKFEDDPSQFLSSTP